jgi:hypothetical protein
VVKTFWPKKSKINPDWGIALLYGICVWSGYALWDNFCLNSFLTIGKGSAHNATY